MTDPISLAPILAPEERPTPSSPTTRSPTNSATTLFVEHVHGGQKVEARDWMPDEYRQSVLRFVEMHANSELMGVLPEREWIMRAPTLEAEAGADGQGPGRVRPRAAAVPRRRGPGQVARADVPGPARRQDEVPQRLPLPDQVVGRRRHHRLARRRRRDRRPAGAARLVATARTARTMKKICWEESVHIMHGRDVVVTMMNGSQMQRDMVQEALDRWWGPLMQMHGPRTDPAKDRDLYWRIKEKTGEQLRQEFLSTYVPRLWEIGLYPARSGAARRSTRRAASGATPSPTGRSCARSSPATGPSPRSGSTSAGSTTTRRRGCARRSSSRPPRDRA